MDRVNVSDQKKDYENALRIGQKQVKELAAEGKPRHPAALDLIVENMERESMQDIGTMEIPVDRVIGVVFAGRASSFSAEFMPLLQVESEFASKWITLCEAHLSGTGIRDSIECIEYFGNFYIQEGNKRLSVLKYFGACRISAHVRRLLPRFDGSMAATVYNEFTAFFRSARTYDIQFRTPGQYATLLSYLGKDLGQEWTESERKNFSSYYYKFKSAYLSLKRIALDLLPEEAFLIWLQIHSLQELKQYSTADLKDSLQMMRHDFVAFSNQGQVDVETEPIKDKKPNLISVINAGLRDKLNIAFVHQRDPETSPWTMAHDEGRKHLEQVYRNKIQTRSYYHADTPQQAEQILEQAAEDGAQVIFTTTPQLGDATLKVAVRNPKIQFLNCSEDAQYASFPSYYCREYEGEFITGAIAGAMAEDNRIGYVASSPVFGAIAAINAFALGAELTNPRAIIELRWTCTGGNVKKSLMDENIGVISNWNIPLMDERYMENGCYGVFRADRAGKTTPLCAVCKQWGVFYVKLVRAVLSGEWDFTRGDKRPVNYWWGIDSGVIDIMLCRSLPDGVRQMANLLQQCISSDMLDPFYRKIVAQDGTIINSGSRTMPPNELLQMNWLCRNIHGSIPSFEKIQPYAESLIRQLGIYRDTIPKQKRTDINEDLSAL